jgi:hypothetical protein
MQRLQGDRVLTRLLPDQISRFWDIIRFAIEESLPPITGEGPDKMNRILSSLLSGKADCWASYVKEKESRRFEGIVITKIQYDDISSTRNLLIYCLYGYEHIESESWTTGLKTLVKYASSKGCHRIIAYTDEPRIIEMVKKLGGETDYTFISIPLV